MIQSVRTTLQELVKTLVSSEKDSIAGNLLTVNPLLEQIEQVCIFIFPLIVLIKNLDTCAGGRNYYINWW